MNALNIESILQVAIGLAVCACVFFIVKFVSHKINNKRKNKASQKIDESESTRKDSDNNQQTAQVHDNTYNASPVITISGSGNNLHIGDKPNVSKEGETSTMQDNEDYLSASILFIDNDKEYGIDVILQKMGFRNVRILDEITSVDMIEIKAAEILFIDFNDVGKEIFGEKQGLGAATAIKRKYPNKKIILYSGAPHMLDNELALLDGTLTKNAAPEQFRAMIEELYYKIHQL